MLTWVLVQEAMETPIADAANVALGKYICQDGLAQVGTLPGATPYLLVLSSLWGTCTSHVRGEFLTSLLYFILTTVLKGCVPFKCQVRKEPFASPAPCSTLTWHLSLLTVSAAQLRSEGRG